MIGTKNASVNSTMSGSLSHSNQICPVGSNLGDPRQRYLCKSCGKKFSANVHSIDKMSRRAFDFHAHHIENFAGSQYDPNHINQAIGRDSLFIYDFNFSPLKRKARMSNWQKGTLLALNEKDGRYNPSAIRMVTVDLLKRLYTKRPCKNTILALISDEHFQYKRAVQKDLAKYKIEHITISSKAFRNYQNILFPVNHADLMIRQRLAAFSRETISFSKTHGTIPNLEKPANGRIKDQIDETPGFNHQAIIQNKTPMTPAMGESKDAQSVVKITQIKTKSN